MIIKPEPPIDEIRQVLSFVWEVLEHGRSTSGQPLMGALNAVEQWAKPSNAGPNRSKGDGRDEPSPWDAIRAEYIAVENALKDLQEKLATLDGWRHSLAWETVERTNETLALGLQHAFEYPRKPKDFRHWREKYSDDTFPY
jgi:hypothetical protein